MEKVKREERSEGEGGREGGRKEGKKKIREWKGDKGTGGVSLAEKLLTCGGK